MRSEGMGVRATARVEEVSHSTIIQWEQRFVSSEQSWSPGVCETADVTVEGDELYTKVAKNRPAKSLGWTVTVLERQSRYWVVAIAGRRDSHLFEQGMTLLWQWVAVAPFIRLFTDGEPLYTQWFWKLACIWLQYSTLPAAYRNRKVWREGIEVASTVKGSQGHRRIKRSQAEHPFTAVSEDSRVHANHNEAHNSSIRRRCSAYRREQNHYAKTVDGLNRAICSLRLIHNWGRPHLSLEGKTTPAMAMGFIDRPITLLEMLCSRGWQHIS